MLFLPEITGRFPVGATTFTTPVRPPQAVGSLSLRNSKHPALYLEEVAFTAYYPADVTRQSTRKGVNWVLRPLKESLRGFAKFSAISHWVLWPLVYFFGAFIRIPVYQNAPLLPPEKAKSMTTEPKETFVSEQWPLVIFSHGLGGSRTAYSQLCSQIAASGKVVLALEHRDGTGPICIPRSWTAEGKNESNPIVYYHDDDVFLSDDATDNATPPPLRTDQLDFRRRETYIAYDTFCRFVQNDPSLEFATIDSGEIDVNSWSSVDPILDERPVSCTQNVTLAGHSFGACTVLSILTTEPPEGVAPIPIARALVLDPWLEPLPTSGPRYLLPSPSSSPMSTSTCITSSLGTSTPNEEHEVQERENHLPRMLVINSETFTLWKDHYERLRDIVKGWEPQGRRIVTLVGSKHAAFSDFPLLPLVRTTSAQSLMSTISLLSVAFIDDWLEAALSSSEERKMEVEILGEKKKGWPKKKLLGNTGDIVIE